MKNGQSAVPRAAGLADAYGRYAVLIADQLTAIERGDETAFEIATRQRDLLANAIDRMNGDALDAEEALEVHRQVEACLAADHRLRDRLGSIHAQSLAAARRLEGNRAAIRSYATHVPAGSRFDRSL
jgi:hypothetical protein